MNDKNYITQADDREETIPNDMRYVPRDIGLYERCTEADTRTPEALFPHSLPSYPLGVGRGGSYAQDHGGIHDGIGL